MVRALTSTMPRELERSTIPLPQILDNRGLSYSPTMCNHHFHPYPPLYIPFIIENYPEVACSSPIYLEKLVRPLEPPLRINRGTRAQFSFDHELPLPELIYFNPSGYPIGMGDRSFEAGSQNYGFVYEQPPPAPFLAAPLALSLSPITTPPKYRAIQP